jgi:hypothetical protein
MKFRFSLEKIELSKENMASLSITAFGFFLLFSPPIAQIELFEFSQFFSW